MRKGFRAATTRLLVPAAVVLILVFATVGAGFADYSAWHYSKNIDVNSGACARVDAPVELQASFTEWLAAAGGSGKTLDLHSIRVVEYASAARTTVVGEKPSQFDRGADFDATANAAGEVVWILDGSTPDSTTRYYTIYFDVTQNGTKTAPNYTTNLSWNPSTSAVETGGFRATYSPNSGGIRRLESKLSGAAKVMWDVDEGDWWRMGQWHTLNEPDSGWIDSWGGKSAVNTVVAGPVRVTVTSVNNEGRTLWTMVRKYYAGSSPTPYWRAAIKAEKNPGAPGQGLVWLKRVVWNNIGGATRTLVPPMNYGGWTTHHLVYEHGPDGGVGTASSFDYLPNSSEEWDGSTHYWADSQYDCWGETWRIKAYPIVMHYAFVVHGGTSAASGEAAMMAAHEDYNNPVLVAVQNTGTLTGTVVGFTTGEPVAGAIVRLRSGSFSATTYASASGAFSISGAPVGSATFSVKAANYDALMDTVSISAGINNTNVMLYPNEYIDLRSTSLGGGANWLLGKDINSGGPVNPPYDDFSAVGADESAFVPTEVPSDWDMQQGTATAIYGWLRTHITVPASWAGKNLRLKNYRGDDVDAAYFNGTKIGQVGGFPPDDDPRNIGKTIWAWAIAREYWVPSSVVNYGGDNVIAIRIWDPANPGGIPVGAPILEVAPPSAVVTGVVSGGAGPIAGASVYIEGVGTTTTSGSGVYTFPYVIGDVYKVKATAFGYKDKTLTIDVSDTGTFTQNIVLENAGAIVGTVTRAGVPLANCRVHVTGPTPASMLTNSSGQYAISVLPGSYQVLFNALNVVPRTESVTVSSTATLNVDLQFGVTPVYDAFAGSSLDTSKWDLWNMEPLESGDAVVTVANGVASVEVAKHRGGMLSKTYFPKICTHEVIFPREYVGPNQIMSLYGGSGEWGNFVEMANEGFIGENRRVAVYGTISSGWSAAVSPTYPMSVAMVRTDRYYDFYINGEYRHSDTTVGVPDAARMYLYGYEYAVGETIAYFSSVCAGTPVAPVATGVGGCRASAAGTAVSISGAVVSASFADAFWIQNTDRSAGIKVISAANPTPGQVVNVVGRLVRINKEAAIQAVSVAPAGSATVPEPVAFNSRTAAGMDGAGASVQGLRVTMFGTYTGETMDDEGFITGLFLDDGSSLPGDGTCKGFYVPIERDWVLGFWFPPYSGQFVTVTGVLTVDTSTGSPLPAVRPQSYTDILY